MKRTASPNKALKAYVLIDNTAQLEVARVHARDLQHAREKAEALFGKETLADVAIVSFAELQAETAEFREFTRLCREEKRNVHSLLL